MARAELSPALQAKADAAKDSFDRAVPRAVDVRDVLDHFDEYLSGTGKLQKRVNSTAPATIEHDNEFTSHTIELVVAPSLVLTIDVESAAKAAVDMMDEMFALIRIELDAEDERRRIAAQPSNPGGEQ
jgi:hypothetical protein